MSTVVNTEVTKLAELKFVLSKKVKSREISLKALEKFVLGNDKDWETRIPNPIITVDYDRSIKKGIAAGHYDSTEDRVVEDYFPKKKGENGKKKKLFYLFYSFFNMDTASVIRRMDEEGKRPATLRELLAFGEVYPEFQRRSIIPALNSSVRFEYSSAQGRIITIVNPRRIPNGLFLANYFPCLEGQHNYRQLTLMPIDENRTHEYLFLCVYR